MKQRKLARKKLARKLEAMYDGAPEGEKVAHIILFGIKYAEELDDAAKQAGCPIWKIIKSSGLKKSLNLKKYTYTSEINYGMTLAKYVKPKKSDRARLEALTGGL